MNINFESIKKIDESGIEYWTARELFVELGYAKWDNFVQVLHKAKMACIKSGQQAEDHFTDIGKMIRIAKSAMREIADYKLSRYACYLIAQNGDSDKEEIALAQTYFAVQTRRQEISDELTINEKRLLDREDIKKQNKKLFSTARLAGVSNFGKFNDAGYKGLYTMSLSEIESKKGIKKGELLDRSGSEELGANLFRITQTEAKLKRENIRGDSESQKTHFDVGKKVRQTIKEIGGDMPEELKPERHIKQVKKDLKIKNKKEMKKLE